MRIIAEAALRAWTKEHARATSSLRTWVKVVRATRWSTWAQLHCLFPSADLVRAASGRNVVVFNVGGGEFRLVCAVHFNTGMVFVLRFLTHAEYSKETWKNEL